MTNNAKFLITQIETVEFREWFGASKVVDANGNPLIVYHTTPVHFTTFDTTSFKTHFGTKEQAEDRAKELALMGITKEKGYNVKLIPVFLSIKNPFRVRDLGDNWKSPSAFSREIENNLGLPANSTHDEFDAIYNIIKSDTVTIVQMLKNRGYDGVVYRNEFEGVGNPLGIGGIAPTGKHSGDSYIPFEPTQVKPIEGTATLVF